MDFECVARMDWQQKSKAIDVNINGHPKTTRLKTLPNVYPHAACDNSCLLSLAQLEWIFNFFFCFVFRFDVQNSQENLSSKTEVKRKCKLVVNY